MKLGTRIFITMAAAAAVLVSTSGLASARGISAPSRAPITHSVAATSSNCSDPSLGGAFYCSSSYSDGEAWYQFPNGHWQLFVIGTDHAVWTRWQESTGAYHSWTSMGGYSTSFPVVLNGSGYSPQINVIGRDGSYWWYRVRNSSTGVWSPWACCA